ncbi:hypothetical protein VP01_303g5 [Puccinia sorghi]|uniref:N-acetylglucosaminylphosphatidylinositol deacetylase n=1 Tax=Puccinia sorghi TaxID=27349 RepID=A0A0L6V0S0_9BASI|nr:hypothetical protein VP01_303g5 [Puccinia sorghi]
MQQQLHHRTNNRQSQQRQTETTSAASWDEKAASKDEKKLFKPTARLASPTSRLAKALKYLMGAVLLVSLGVYALVLVFKDWPPDGRLGPDGFPDPLQGEWWVSPNLTRADRILLVVAHPDDECLFFSPTLLNILSPRFVNRTLSYHATNLSSHTPPSITLETPRGHILSLSSGEKPVMIDNRARNADGLGIKRAREMRASCWAMGIPSTACIVLDHPDLPDSMSVWWPETTIAEYVKLYVDLWKIDAIITFDHHGVSGHANHRAIAAALSRMVHTEREFPMTFMLRSRSLVEKYMGLIWLPYSVYRHGRNRKLFLPELSRPRSHPSRDRKRLAELVVESLTHVGVSLSSANLSIHHHVPAERHEARNNASSSPMAFGGVGPRRRALVTDSRLSAHHSLLWLLTSRFMWINELARVVPLEHRFQDHHTFSLPTHAENIICSHVYVTRVFQTSQVMRLVKEGLAVELVISHFVFPASISQSPVTLCDISFRFSLHIVWGAGVVGTFSSSFHIPLCALLLQEKKEEKMGT